MIHDLRYITRNGKEVLQYRLVKKGFLVDILSDWQDIPVVSGERKVTITKSELVQAFKNLNYSDDGCAIALARYFGLEPEVNTTPVGDRVYRRGGGPS